MIRTLRKQIQDKFSPGKQFRFRIVLIFLVIAGPVFLYVLFGIRRVLVSQPHHSILFYDEKLFTYGLRTSDLKPVPYFVRSGIVPHHLVASRLLSEYFHMVSGQKPRRIILIGPNHHEVGGAHAISSLLPWETPYGRVVPDTKVITGLQRESWIQVNEAVSEGEHSVAGLMPYIAYYLPGTAVVPVIVSNRMKLDEIMMFSERISRLADKDTVVLASVDFSHHLLRNAALDKDTETERLMRQFSYGRLFSLDSTYMDSPPSVIIALKVAEILKSRKMEIVHHTNSGIVLNNSGSESTSYFTIALHE